jgi:putative oxidoreductase
MKPVKSIRLLDLVPLLVRIALAVVFIYHGYGKVFQGGHEGIAQLMSAKGAPLPEVLGWLAGLTEFFGGILIGVGLLSRVWALGLVVVMAVAIATVHGPNGFDLRQQGYEYNFTLGLCALAILIGGPGAFSLDRFLFARKFKKPTTE